MPVWHEKTKAWVEQGKLAIVGVIQEQHPERCRLFAQWKGFGWPILHDPINVLNTTAVPIVMAIDEHGVVRSKRPRIEDFESTFLNQKFSKSSPSPAAAPLTPSRDAAELAAAAKTSELGSDWRAWGDCLTIWHASERLDDAIRAYTQALALDPNDLASRFRLGVCHRMRAESVDRQADDFSKAVAAWESALAGNPNQYIWRRRIQQYGPRLIKPYPFYDWVTTAEADIRRSGGVPISLPVRPSGAEIARPSQQFGVSESSAVDPDPTGAIHRDDRELILVSSATVPSRAAAGSTVRVHVRFQPNAQLRAHWNNEADPLAVWIDPPAGGQVSRQLITTEPVAEATSHEIRRLDFELELPEKATGHVRLSGHALYYVCEGIDGECLYLRQDLHLDIPIASGA